MTIISGVLVGVTAWLIVRYGFVGFYTIGPNERAVIASFGRAQRVGDATTASDPVSDSLSDDEKERYIYPQVRVVGPGFYWKWPWQKVYRTSIATITASIAYDPEDARANQNGTVLEAVTKDQLNTGLTGQIRFSVSERNLYAYLFGVKKPVAHVLGYFVSILRDRIANFEVPHTAVEPENLDPEDADVSSIVQGISINDLRKNLRDLNERMDDECRSAAARYGISLDAALITGIDPPPEVDSALAAINTAHNHVSSEISLAQSTADQRIVLSKRAVEIETLNAQAEVEPLLALAEQLRELLGSGGLGALDAYVRNTKIPLHRKAGQMVMADAKGGRS